MQTVLSFLKKYRVTAAAALLMMLTELTVELMQPFLIAKIIDEGIRHRDLSVVWLWGGVLVGSAVLAFAAGILSSFWASYASQGFGYDLRARLYQKVQSLGYDVFSRFATSSLITRLTGDVNQLQETVFMSLRFMTRVPLVVLGSMAMALAVDLKLGLLLAAAVPFLVVFLVWVMRKSSSLFRGVQKRLDAVNGVIQENLTGIRLIRVFVRMRRENERFAGTASSLKEGTVGALRLTETTMPIILLVMNLGIVVMLWFGRIGIEDGSATLGETVAVINYTLRIIGALSALSWIVTVFSRAQASAQRVTEVLAADDAGETERNHEAEDRKRLVSSGRPKEDGKGFAKDIERTEAGGKRLAKDSERREDDNERLAKDSERQEDDNERLVKGSERLKEVGNPSIQVAGRSGKGNEPSAAGDQADQAEGSGGTLRRGAVQGELEFRDVSFAYPGGGGEVLAHVSFRARAGARVAIMGATGSGKTTLVQLIPRLYEPTSGEIVLDGRNIRQMDERELREAIGYVPQDVLLFSGTVRDNIAWGSRRADEADIRLAAKRAQIHDTVMKLPQGYDTPLGQRGVNLSGGQKQRLSIARALVKEPALLILDDSTSALDVATEGALLDALEELSCTTLLITQKISSTASADLILLLDDGRLIASGSHAELLASSGLYRAIHESQAGEEAHHAESFT